MKVDRLAKCLHGRRHERLPDHGAIIQRAGQLALTSTIPAMGTSRTIETLDAGPAMSGELL